ncbi:MAG TPA: carboxypeptidase regulatory-like domain-containing protein [Acidobacteriota bacterium]|nr:carboxypeptidase regulatory-like domain-containing protein [Acidobacteriota bacterium]
MLRISGLAAALVFLLCASLAAQTAGTISGTVKDSSGAVIPGAEVKLVNQATAASRNVVSDDTGFYTFLNVEVGNYRLTSSMEGFKTAVVRDVKVDVRSNRVIDLRLELGEMSEEMTVTSSSAQVELRSGAVSNLITGEQVTELPLNNRSFVQLATLVPGAAVSQDAAVSNTGLLAGVDISFSGSPGNANMWLVDGTNNVDIGSGRTILTYPSVDSIAEFKIQRNSYEADMGASSGAQVNVVTKSGTNEFHGTFYHFHRNDNLNATDFFLNSAGSEKQSLVYNNFGYTVGGPIVSDRLFFFWSQEWRKDRRGVPRQALVPTLAERQGDFSGPSSRDPLPVNPFTGQPFDNNQIPGDLLSPAGQAIMALFPAPTLSTADARFNGFNWVASPSSPIDTRQEQFRLDFNLNSTHSFMGRFTKDSWTNSSPSFQEGGLWGDDPFPAVDSQWDQPARSLTTQWTSTFGADTVNQLSFSWSGNEIDIQRGTGESINSAINSAIPEVFPGPDDHAHATVWAGVLGNDLWHQAPWTNRQDLLVWKDDFSKVVGDHSMRFGVLVSHNRKEEDTNANGASFAPQFWSDGGRAIPAAWNGVPGSTDTTGNAVADFILRGTVFGEGIENTANPRANIRWRDYEFYFADTWRVHPRFTLNYGVRYSILPNAFADDDRIANFVPALVDPAEGATSTNGLIFPGDIRGLDVDDRALVENHYLDIAPRLGFAWDPTGEGRWAIRAGAGVFFNREALGDLLSLAINPPYNTSRGFVTGRPLDSIPENTDTFGGDGVAQNGKDPRAKTPGSYQWNVTVERELWRDTKFEVAYVGNRGHHIPTRIFSNQVPVEDRTQFAILTLNNDTAGANALRPFNFLVGGGSGPVIFARFADSWYHAFQAYLVKRFSNSFSYQLSYTYSKLLATSYNLNEVRSSTVSDLTNIAYDKGLSQFDRPHLFTANFIYRTPSLSGANGLVRGFLGDWELATIVTANSGRAESVTCCTNFTGTQANRPDLVGNPEGPETISQYFNTAAFAPPDQVGRLGLSPRAQYRGPGIHNWDVSFIKNVHGLPWFTNEGAQLQFRAEFFNFFNHTNPQFIDNGFAISVGDIDEQGNLLDFEQTNPNFGRVTRVRPPREIQFGLKLIW